MIRPLYAPGDRVVVIGEFHEHQEYYMADDPNHEGTFGTGIEQRQLVAGSVLTIDEVVSRGSPYYTVLEKDHGAHTLIWTDEMFEGLESEKDSGACIDESSLMEVLNAF